MSLKPCTFKLTGVKGELSYDQMRKHLMENPDLWVGKKYSKVSPVKIVVNKFSKTIADKFDKLSKAMGFDTKLEFISEAEAREILRTDPANVKKMLAGPNSKRSKQVRDNYFVAVEMQNSGVDSEKIWQATGWEMMPDGKWRYEIPTDRLATAFESERQSEGKNFQTYVANKVKDLLKKGTTLGQLFPNGSLLAAYPGFKDMKVLLDYTLTGAAGYYDYENKRIVLSSDLITGYFLDAHNIEQVLLHETQHAIQHKEGFARGGNLSSKDTAESQELSKFRDDFLNSNPDFKVKMVEHRDARQERQAAYDAYIANISDRKNVKRLKEAELRVSAIEKELVNDPLYKKLRDILQPIKNKYGAILPYDFYRNLLGEVESRNVSETRVFMSEEERRKTPPSKTSDIKPASATVFYIDEDDKRGYSQGSSAGFSTTRDGKPVGFQYDTEQVARERFDLSKFEKIGSGSDRDVFDLGNGKVLKIAKNGRGLEQNIYEGDFYLSEAGVIPEAFERGLNYVVVENVPRIKSSDTVFTYDLETGEINGETTAGEMLSDLSAFSQRDFDKKSSALQDVFRKYGLETALDYDILYGDFTRKANWGYINGKAVHIDGGTFGGVDAIIGNKNKALNDAEFRDVYKKSQELKRKLQDTDKYTRYMRTPDGYVMGFVQRQDDGSYKVFIDPKVVNPETPIHEIAGHVFLPIVKETNPELYAKGVDLIKDSPYMDRVKQEYPELSEEEMYEEALAQAVGEKGALLKDQKKKGFVDWLKTFWQKTADVLGIKVSPEQLAEMDLNKFTDLIAGSILNAEDLIKIKQQTVVEEGQSTAKTEDPVGQLLTGSTQEQKEAAFDQIVGEAADTETEGRDEYEQERPQGKSFAESVKDDVRAYLKKGQDALTNYSDKAKAFIKNVSLRTKRVIAIAMLSGGLLSGAVNYVQANNDGYIPSISDITALGERALIKLGLVEIPENAGLVNVDEIIDKKPEKVVIRPDSGKATSEPVVFNILGKVTDWKQESQGFKLWMYQRDADNGHLVYVPGPHKRNFKAYGASGVANVEGVGHFLVSPQDLTHLTSNPLLKKLKEQFLAEIKYKTPDAWVPTFKKENNNLVRLTLKKLGDVKEEDIVVSQLHQTPFLDIDTNARLNPGQFNSSIHCLAKKSTGEKLEQYLMGPTKDNYNQCSGGSFFILAETPKGLKIREMSGPINLMLKDAYRFAKKNGVGMDKITIGVLDAGSYSAKPVADEKNVVRLEQYEKYNTGPDIDLQGGAALMIPEGGGVEFRKAMELSENEENTPDNIAAIVNVMNTLPGAGIERNIYTITQQRGVLDTKKSKRKGIVKDVPVVSIDDFLGRPVLFTISDELTTGEITNPYTGQKIKNLKGGLYFNYSEGNTEHAWAFTEKSKADGLLKQAKELYRKHPEKYPDGIVPVAVVKMGVQAMESNEAILRQLEQNIPSFPAENKAAALAALPADIQKQIDGLQEKIDLIKSKGEKPTSGLTGALRGLKKALELAKNTKSFDVFVKQIKTLNINARPLIIARITTGKSGLPIEKATKAVSDKPAVQALMEGLDPQEGLKLKIGNLVANITEPSLKNVPNNHIISFVGVDAKANDSVTINSHPNYPAALKGKGLGVLKDTVHIASVSPSTYAAVIGKMAAAGADIISASVAISRATGAGLAHKFLRGESLVKDLSDFDKLVGVLRLAFPSVQFFTDANSWADIMANPDVKKYVKNGEVVYGLTKDGSIYLNPDIKDFNTPIHEAGHIWVDMLEQTNNDLLQQGFKLIEGTKELAAAIAEKGDNIMARKEALAVLIGNKGESIVNAAQQARFGNWLNAMFQYVQKTFKSLLKVPANKLANITLNQFVEGAIADILGGKEVAGKVVATSEAQFAADGVYSSVEATAKALESIGPNKFKEKINLIANALKETVVKEKDRIQALGNKATEEEIDAYFKLKEQSNKIGDIAKYGSNAIKYDEITKEFADIDSQLENPDIKYKQGKQIGQENFGKIYEADGDGILYRGVSKEDYERIQKQGFIDSDLRGVISTAEGINLGKNPNTSANYLPNNIGGYILAIDPKRLNLFTTDADNYIRTKDSIPFENVLKVSEYIGKNEMGAMYRQSKFSEDVSKAYHAAKRDGSNPELVAAVEQALGKPSSEPQFRKSLPINLRNAIQDLINEQKANPTKIYFYEVLARARGLMQAAGLSEADIDAQVKAMEEREEAKTESEYFSDYVSKLKAAAKLTIPEARALMKQFRNFLNSEEDLADAMDFVDRLVKKKDLLDKVNKAKDAFKALKKLRNSKKLTAADQRFIANLAIPRFYLLDEATLIKLREMATNFVDSRVNQSPVKFEISEIDAAFNEASKVMPSKTRKAGVRKIARMTLAEMQFRTKQALQEYANEIPSAKELLGMDLSLLDKDALNLISNALKTYDETGVLFSIPAIVETVRALNDAKRIQKSGIIANIQKLAAGGIAGRLQSLAANADEIRRMLVGGWDRNAARVTIETQELRTQIDQVFSKLGISDTDKFTLGAYGFFKEETGGQTPEIKANVLAAQMNNLRDQIAAAKEMNSDSQEVAMLQHYYSGNTEALKALGVIKLENGQWVAADNINVDALAPDKVKKAWEYAQNILTSKTAAYTAAMAEYHGKDFDQIFQYYPRSFYKTDVSKADLQAAAEDLPPMGSIDPKTTKQDTDIAARNEGRTNTMPKRGGFYILDGYETLVNGVWDINATIELSKAYAYTNALINKANITNNADTNGQIKKYIVSSVKGILRDPMIFPDNRSGREKFGSAFFNIVTTTILNNFTQLFKQTMGVTAGFVTNPAATIQAMGLIMKGMGDKKTQEALDRFYKNTSEPYTLALSYIELDTLGRNKGPVMDKITGVFDKIKPEYLVNANRFTQRMLLLSGYLANTNPDKFVENSNNGVFNETALAAAENNAEMANSTANRHFLPLQLKDAGTMKKFLYFLGTYNFVTTSNFWSNARILQGAGYTKLQKEIATKQMASLAVQQVMYQLMLRAVGEGLKAIGRDLDWLDEESEEQRKKRFMKYFYQVPASVVMDLTVGPMVSLLGDALKSATIVASEVVYDIASEGATGDKLDLLFKRSNDYPGVYGVVAPLIEQMYKAAKSKDQEFQIAVAVQATAMLMAWGDLYYLARIKAQTIQSILKVAGGDEVMKAFRDGNSPEYKNWVNTIRERNIPDKFIFKMSWQDDGIGYYVPASEMSKFVQVYNKEYLNEIHLLTMRNKYVPVKKRKSAEQLKKSAENAAALEAQKSIKNPHKFKMPAK